MNKNDVFCEILSKLREEKKLVYISNRRPFTRKSDIGVQIHERKVKTLIR
jgi:hypothetical protein